MNKQCYSFGNPFKIKFREHYCYKCGTKLSIIKHHKVVDQKSDEAKYYDFSVGVDGGVMIGSCEFIHNVFYCQKCSQNIEFVTQINQEDIDILIKHVQNHFDNKGRKVNIKKRFENIENKIEENCNIESVRNLCLFIEENGKDTLVYKIPICRKKNWERPYYFKTNKRDLIRFIQKQNRV